MGLLDGGLKGIFGTAFGPIFLAGEIHVGTRTDDAGGSISVAYANHDCKAIAVDYSENQRTQGGYGEKDVEIIILQASTTAPRLDADCQATVKRPGTTEGVRYAISAPIRQDPAGATWTARGTPV